MIQRQKRRISHRHLGIAGCLFMSMLLAASHAGAYTVGKECIEDFSACGISNLPSACDALDRAGDFGGSVSFYWQNNDVWESDFKDEALGGEDWLYADNVDVFLFSGHGTAGGIDNWLGLRTPGTPGAPCGWAESGDGASEMRFNREAELIFFDASCSGSFPERYAVWYGDDATGMLVDAKQGFAFMNSPSDNDHRFYKFLAFSNSGMSNVDAWLEAGSGCIGGIDCDDESPIIFTKGDSTADATYRATYMTMSNFESFTDPRGGYYRWNRVDNGGCS